MVRDKEKQRAWHKAYYKANKERIKSQTNLYRKSNKEKVKVYQKAYREANREKIEAQKKAHYVANKNQYKVYKKAYYKINKRRLDSMGKANYQLNKKKVIAQKKLYNTSHKEKRKIWCKKHYDSHKEEKRIYSKRYLSLKKNEENKRRKKLGLPLVGEGFRNEMLLLLHVSHIFEGETIISHDKITLDGLELDIYIPSLKLAFEYQGGQHYKIDGFFIKTKEQFEAQQFRDQRKKELCKGKGIILIEVRFDEQLSEQLILEKLKDYNFELKQKRL